MSPSVRREAIEVLFSRKGGVEVVVDALESHALHASELDPARLKQLDSQPDPAMRARIHKALAAEGTGSRDRNKAIASFRPALQLGGDPVKGREIHTKICATCHQAEGHGFSVGPDLATVATRTPEDLLTHILDPNREVAPNFVNYNVEINDGRVVSGIIANESASAISLKRAEGASDTIPRDRIESISSTGLSLMPDGLEKGLSPQDLANLMAFIRSVRASAPTSPAPAAAK
jgi:putative heme-binding domain-containing protein